ncbi:MAG TPA: hypothetical protein VN577_03850 [Terriglobales bacterium]|nr:hypothetical protein [Terriglobales bacterium]
MLLPLGEKDHGSEPNLQVTRSAGGRYYRLRYRDQSEFVVRDDGSMAWANWPPSLTLEDAATYLLGPVIGLVLRLRGTTCLHAAAAEIRDRLAVFTGTAGAGKSSLCAAMSLRGHRVSGDDVLPLFQNAGQYTACAAYPRVRLWPDSTAALCGNAEALELLTPNWDKRFLAVDTTDRRLIEGRPSIGCIYVLSGRSEGGSISIEELSAREALIDLVANTYANYLLDRRMRAEELQFLSGLVHTIPVFRVRVTQGLHLLPQACDEMEQHFLEVISNTRV